ncbi:putative anion transporter 6 [Hibiscus syriacus]|uniref:Anion transporter 6 n=1 Tax=Hibiscus syriacus TaxID=106335 RepID=A0A6A2YTN7_HIBSY|nr:putative anion transporter 6 [Hibiscus syriacus]
MGRESSSREAGFDLGWPQWKNIPQRYKLIGTTSLAFVICNMDKVNLSVAIIPMSHQFGWNSSVAGLVQFFWGYALSQLPGGWLSKIFGGRKVIEIGVLAWSLATELVPVLAGFMPGLLLSRILVGIGEGVSPSAATDLIARSIPLEERSRAVSFVFGGLSVGSVTGYLVAPTLIQNFGWESVFYIFGLLGIWWRRPTFRCR